jgi:type IV secretion system protein VirB8
MKIINKIYTWWNDKDRKNSKEAMQRVKNWYTDRYETVLVQRNLLFLILAVSIVTIALSLLVIRYIKSTRSLEPFVIEIEQKTGVPTVVDPLTIEAYSADQAIKRYFVLKYLKAREEFYFNTYRYSYDTVVRVLSSPDVYYKDYQPKFSIGNPNSPVNLYAQHTYRIVQLKSLIFTTPNTAQVRFVLETNGAVASRVDKVALIQFDFENLKMNDEERLINPLGFRVTLYRIEDEK